MVDRRAYPRYRAELEVEYDVTNDFEIQSKTHTYNISRVGVAMPLNKAIKPGKKIGLKIKMPYEDKEILAVGKVVWKQPINKNLPDEEDAGIKFLSMDENSADTFKGYLQDIAVAA